MNAATMVWVAGGLIAVQVLVVGLVLWVRRSMGQYAGQISEENATALSCNRIILGQNDCLLQDNKKILSELKRIKGEKVA